VGPLIAKTTMKALHARFARTKSWFGRLDHCYALIALLIGFLYLLITPPFQVPDEPNHFFRCYQISEGHLLPERLESQVGGEIPRSLIDTVQEVGGEYTFDRVGLILEYLDYHPPKGHRNRWNQLPDRPGDE
jgi:hypothetical protein